MSGKRGMEVIRPKLFDFVTRTNPVYAPVVRRRFFGFM